MERKCLYCGKAINGRADKKFCDDQCRSGYYHIHKNESPDAFKTINRALKKNREAMSRLNPEGKTKVSLGKLLAAGFNPKYHTHLYKTKKGDTYFFCYEYGYLQLANDEFLLVKNESAPQVRST